MPKAVLTLETSEEKLRKELTGRPRPIVGLLSKSREGFLFEQMLLGRAGQHFRLEMGGLGALQHVA